MCTTRRHVLGTIAGALVLGGAARTVRAETYPARPIRLVIPFPPGGAFDAVGRPLAEKLNAILGTIVVENIGGGGSSLGASSVARAKPDGYTLLLGGTQTHVNEALLKGKPLYDPIKDLDPIADVVSYYLAIAIHPDIPATSLSAFIGHAKASPGKLSYGHAGVGSIQHLTGELFKAQTGSPDVVQVAYRGTGPAITDLVSGHIPMAVLGINGQVLELHRAGKIKILAVTAGRRLLAAPELPTVGELGLSGLTVTGTIGLLAPAGVSADIATAVAGTTRTALADSTFQKQLIEGGFEPAAAANPAKLKELLAADIALWAPIVKSIGLKIE